MHKHSSVVPIVTDNYDVIANSTIRDTGKGKMCLWYAVPHPMGQGHKVADVIWKCLTQKYMHTINIYEYCHLYISTFTGNVKFCKKMQTNLEQYAPDHTIQLRNFCWFFFFLANSATIKPFKLRCLNKNVHGLNFFSYF